MSMATYCYYEKVRRTMRTAIVSYLLKTSFYWKFHKILEFIFHLSGHPTLKKYVLKIEEN